jgi:hypothetical protein
MQITSSSVQQYLRRKHVYFWLNFFIKPKITEADNWIISKFGEVTLIASASKSSQKCEPRFTLKQVYLHPPIDTFIFGCRVIACIETCLCIFPFHF